MGILRRWAERASGQAREANALPVGTVQVSATLYTGDDRLEVVGESNYQDALWSAVGGQSDGYIRADVTAVLVPEPDNPYDANAISVQVSGAVVGYLRRGDAANYLPGLRRLMDEHQTYVALDGVIVGGIGADGGLGMLGIYLAHDPGDFGVAARELPAMHRGSLSGGTLDTGFTEAWRADPSDDDYDLAWADDLPEADRPAIARLRELLATETALISRHFQYAELEKRLYHCRDLYSTALDEFDEVCTLHDAEMDQMRVEFMTKWSRVPRLTTYRQMAIRLAKARDWEGVKHWAERGLAVYGHAAARESAVEDLTMRLNIANAKLTEPMKPENTQRVRAGTNHRARPATAEPRIETLTCALCASTFERPVQRGRKPHLCPDCRQ
ncbi:MAG: HIRAN domain-containing protein [Acidimicrobiia bacterium]